MNDLTQLATLFQHTQDALQRQATRAVDSSGSVEGVKRKI